MAETIETGTSTIETVEVTKPAADQPVDVTVVEAVEIPQVAAPPITIPVAPPQTAAHLTLNSMSAISAVDRAYGRR